MESHHEVKEKMMSATIHNKAISHEMIDTCRNLINELGFDEFLECVAMTCSAIDDDLLDSGDLSGADHWNELVSKVLVFKEDLKRKES